MHEYSALQVESWASSKSEAGIGIGLLLLEGIRAFQMSFAPLLIRRSCELQGSRSWILKVWALYEPLGMLTQIPVLIPISVSWHRYLFDHLGCATAGEALYTAFCHVSMLSLSLARAVSAFNTGLQTALYFVVSSSILRSRRFGGKTIDIIC